MNQMKPLLQPLINKIIFFYFQPLKTHITLVVGEEGFLSKEKGGVGRVIITLKVFKSRTILVGKHFSFFTIS